MNNDVKLPQVPNSSLLNERVDILFRELEMAGHWERPSILFAIYRTDTIRDLAMAALRESLGSIGQKVQMLLLNGGDMSEFLQQVTRPGDLAHTILFIDGFSHDGATDGSRIFEEINRYREYFIDNSLRAVFWLFDEDVQKFAARATECWYLRHRVIDLSEEIQPNRLFLETLDDFLKDHEVLCLRGEPSKCFHPEIEEYFTELSVQPSHAASLLVLGMLCLQRNDEPNARKFLQAALNIAKSSSDGELQVQCIKALASMEAGAGNIQNAITLYRQAIPLTAKPALLWKNIGLLHNSRGEYQQAVGALLNAVNDARQDPSSWLELGNAYFNLGQFDKALPAFETVLEISPTSEAAWVGLGKTALALDDNERAVAAFRKAAELNPKNDQAWLSLGNGLLHQKSEVEAMDAFQKAVRVNPENTEARLELSRIHLSQNKPAEAISTLENVIQLQPDSCHVYHVMGMAEFKRGNYEKAEKLIQQAIPLAEERQTRSKLWEYLARIQLKLKKQELAMSAFRQADRLSKNTTASSQSEDSSQPLPEEEKIMDNGEPDMIESTNVIENRSAQEWNELGNSFLKSGAFKKAVLAYTKAIEAAPENRWPYINNLAAAHYQMGKVTGGKTGGKLEGADPMEAEEEEAIVFSASDNIPLPERNDQAVNDGQATGANAQKPGQPGSYPQSSPEDGGPPGPRRTLVAAAELNEMGNSFMSSGKYEEAVDAYKQSIEADPKFGQPYSNLGFVYYKKRNYRLAVLLYQKSLEHLKNAEDKATTLNRLGDAYRQLHDYENALLAYKKAGELGPSTNPTLDRARFSLCQNSTI